MLDLHSMKDSTPTTDRKDSYQRIGLDLATAQETGLVDLKVVSDSMRPFLQPGDIVRMSPIKARTTLQRGDIIVFQQPESGKGSLPLTHRIIGRSSAGLLAKGDARWLPDAPVKTQAVIGLVVGVQRGQRQITLTSPGWRLINSFLGWFHFMAGGLAALANRARKSLMAGKEVE